MVATVQRLGHTVYESVTSRLPTTNRLLSAIAAVAALAFTACAIYAVFVEAPIVFVGAAVLGATLSVVGIRSLSKASISADSIRTSSSRRKHKKPDNEDGTKKVKEKSSPTSTTPRKLTTTPENEKN